jgi:hypothetical protein
LSFGFGFERSKAWAGCDGPWAVIFVLVGGFAMKMGVGLRTREGPRLTSEFVLRAL